jgi:hypothetical protein
MEIQEAFTNTEPISTGIDGGVKLGVGTFGVILQQDDNAVMRMSGKVPGTEHLFTPYRSEAYSLLAALVLIRNILAFYHIQVPTIKQVQIYSDNISLIRRVEEQDQIINKVGYYNSPDIDVELQIRQEIQKLRYHQVEILLLYVKGHQDQDPGHKLNIAASLNVEADHLARSAYHAQQKAEYFPFPANFASLSINSEAITAKVKTCLRTAYLSIDLQTHMMKQFGWERKTVDTIWWSVHDLAVQQLSHLDRIKIQKFIHDLWPSNHREARYRENIIDQCHSCHQEGENEDHIIRCKCQIRKDIRLQMTAELKIFMTKHQTDNNVSKALLLGIHTWLHGLEAPNPKDHLPTASPALIKAFNQQTTIGWRHVLKGRLAAAWGSFINHQFSNNEAINPTGFKNKPYINHADNWGQGIISIIWNHVLQIWNARNKEEHGEDIVEETSRKKKKLLQEVLNLKNKMTTIYHKDRDLICLSTAKMASSTVSTLKTWIRHTKTLLKINSKEKQLIGHLHKLPFDRGPRQETSTPNQNRVPRPSVQETISTP